MSPLPFRRRPDGLIEIVRTESPARRVDPQALLFPLFVLAIGLFISGKLPLQASALLLGCWIAAELLVALDALLETRRPVAEVRAFAPQRLPTHDG